MVRLRLEQSMVSAPACLIAGVPTPMSIFRLGEVTGNCPVLDSPEPQVAVGYGSISGPSNRHFVESSSEDLLGIGIGEESIWVEAITDGNEVV